MNQQIRIPKNLSAMETYKFYVQMNGATFGPYSARAIRDLELQSNALVTEESMNGQWMPATKFDFDYMICKEEGAPMPPPQSQSFQGQNNSSTPMPPPQSQPFQGQNNSSTPMPPSPSQPFQGQNNSSTPIPPSPSQPFQGHVHSGGGGSFGGGYSSNSSFNPNRGEIPQEINKWNWGAFLLTWIWGVGNGLYWPLAIIIVGLIPYVGWAASLAASIYLGMKGSELAWKAKDWESIEHFKRIQHNWMIAGICALGVYLLITIITFIILMSKY